MRKLDKRPKELKGLKPIEIKKERSYAYSTILHKKDILQDKVMKCYLCAIEKRRKAI